MRAERESGFSLIELLVVISIIAILATIAVPMLLGQRTKAYLKEAEVNLEALRNIQEQFMAERGEYAPSWATADGTIAGLANIQDCGANQACLPGFKPGEDASLNFTYSINYVYTAGITNGFTANATGKNGTPVAGTLLSITQDNVKNW